MKKSKQLVTHDRAARAAKQHASPCAECHAVKIGRRHAECAGVAICRANVVKRPPPGAMELPPDKEDVFATPGEFLDHHAGGGWKAVKARLARADGQDAAEAPVTGSAPTKGER